MLGKTCGKILGVLFLREILNVKTTTTIEKTRPDDIPIGMANPINRSFLASFSLLNVSPLSLAALLALFPLTSHSHLLLDMSFLAKTLMYCA
jgi:hypothetical protein